jgi:malate/lactate dehydrogenase
MERSQMIAINAAGIAEQARSLETYAKPSVKVLVVANPANTNTIVAMNAAPKLRSHQFSCLTRLDHERLRGMASLFCGGAKVRDVAIWGNHSQTQVPYLLAATVTLNGVSRKLAELDGASEFMQAVVPRVQRRGADIIKATGTSSAMSAATAIGYHLADWLSERPSSELFSMGMLSNGNAYGVPPGIVFSFPCHRLRGGEVVIAEGLPITSEMQAMMDQTVEELLAEKREAEAIVGTICVLDSRL